MLLGTREGRDAGACGAGWRAQHGYLDFGGLGGREPSLLIQYPFLSQNQGVENDLKCYLICFAPHSPLFLITI